MKHINIWTKSEDKQILQLNTIAGALKLNRTFNSIAERKEYLISQQLQKNNDKVIINILNDHKYNNC